MVLLSGERATKLPVGAISSEGGAVLCRSDVGKSGGYRMMVLHGISGPMPEAHHQAQLGCAVCGTQTVAALQLRTVAAFAAETVKYAMRGKSRASCCDSVHVPYSPSRGMRNCAHSDRKHGKASC